MVKKDNDKKFNTLAIVGFILSFSVIFSFVGIVLCIIAIVQINRKNQRGMGLAIAGLIIGFVLPILISLTLVGVGVAVFLNSGVVGSGNVVEESFELVDFEAVEIMGGGNLYVTQGEEFSVEIEAEDNILENLVVEIDGDELEIGPKKGVYLRNTKPINVRVTMPNVNGLTVTGSGKIIGTEKLVGENVKLVITGSGEIELEIDADELNSKIVGSGDITLVGRADNHVSFIAGSGDVKAFDLETETTEIRISGSGDAEVFASETLDVIINGSGDVSYRGGGVVTQKVNGSGTVSEV